MNKIKRNEDIVFQLEDLESLFCLKNFPVFMGCTKKDISEDLFFDMNWHISKNSGMIQLNPLIPLEILYMEEHGSGTVGKVWREHHFEFSNFIKKYEVKNVLEIGGLHGELAKNYFTTSSNTNWTIIDPNPTAEANDKLKVIKGFFDETFKSDEIYDCVIHSHVLEHIYDVHTFMKNISSFMKEENTLIFSVPNLNAMLKDNMVNCLNFEHTMFITEPYIEYFLAKYGFEILEKNYFKSNHSIFYSAKRTGKKLIPMLKKDLYEKNKIEFTRYINYLNEDVKNINCVIEKNTDTPVFLFGAHIFSQTLINFGLNIERISGILDNDSNKENKRLYGTNLLSNKPSILKNISKALIILRAGVYNEEIKNDILNNINSNVIFI